MGFGNVWRSVVTIVAVAIVTTPIQMLVEAGIRTSIEDRAKQDTALLFSWILILIAAAIVIVIAALRWNRASQTALQPEEVGLVAGSELRAERTESALRQTRNDNDALRHSFQASERNAKENFDRYRAAEEVAQSARADAAHTRTERDTLRTQSEESAALTGWGSALIEREREVPFRYLQYSARITNAACLSEPNPYFDIIVYVRYAGVMSVYVGDRFADGRLLWQGAAFAERPDFKGRPDFPLSLAGPAAEGAFRLRQYVRDAVAADLRAYFDRRFTEIEFTHELRVSLRIESFNGELLYDGNFPFGEYITIPLDYQ